MAIFRIFIPKVRYLLILKAIRISSIFVIINLFSLASAGAVNNCILITSITIDSTNKYIDKKVKNITNKSLGQCVNITDIKNILREITNLYVDIGSHYDKSIFTRAGPLFRKFTERLGSLS